MHRNYSLLSPVVKAAFATGICILVNGVTVVHVNAYEGKPILLPPMEAKLDLRKISPVKEGDRPTPSRVYTRPTQKLALEYLRHGSKLHKQGHSLIAETFFKKAMKLDPQNPDSHFNLGALYEAKGDYSGALNHYRNGHELAPDDTEILEALRFVEKRVNSPGFSPGLEARADEKAVPLYPSPYSRKAKQPFSLKSSLNSMGTSSQNPPVVSAYQNIPKGKKAFMGPKTRAVLGTLFRVGLSIGVRAAIGGGGCGGGFRF